jgi:hypothetical protein
VADALLPWKRLLETDNPCIIHSCVCSMSRAAHRLRRGAQLRTMVGGGQRLQAGDGAAGFTPEQLEFMKRKESGSMPALKACPDCAGSGARQTARRVSGFTVGQGGSCSASGHPIRALGAAMCPLVPLSVTQRPRVWCTSPQSVERATAGLKDCGPCSATGLNPEDLKPSGEMIHRSPGVNPFGWEAGQQCWLCRCAISTLHPAATAV